MIETNNQIGNEKTIQDATSFVPSLKHLESIVDVQTRLNEILAKLLIKHYKQEEHVNV